MWEDYWCLDSAEGCDQRGVGDQTEAQGLGFEQVLLDETSLKMSVRVSEGDHRARITAKIDQKANMHAYSQQMQMQ